MSKRLDSRTINPVYHSEDDTVEISFIHKGYLRRMIIEREQLVKLAIWATGKREEAVSKAKGESQ